MRGADGGRVVAIDLGEVRVGVAVSDPDGIVATPSRTIAVAGIAEPSALAATLSAAVVELGADRVVVGLPRDLTGRERSAARRAREVARLLEQTTGLPVDLWDERFTSVAAERAMLARGARRRERRAAADRVAATLLLQSYLDARRARRARGGRP